jgi:hypothetical protein
MESADNDYREFLPAIQDKELSDTTQKKIAAFLFDIFSRNLGCIQTSEETQKNLQIAIEKSPYLKMPEFSTPQPIKNTAQIFDAGIINSEEELYNIISKFHTLKYDCLFICEGPLSAIFFERWKNACAGRAFIDYSIKDNPMSYVSTKQFMKVLGMEK